MAVINSLYVPSLPSELPSVLDGGADSHVRVLSGQPASAYAIFQTGVPSEVSQSLTGPIETPPTLKSVAWEMIDLDHPRHSVFAL
jgi:hypothetical protein